MTQENLDIVDEFYGTEQQEAPEYAQQVEAEFIQAFRNGVIRQA